MGGVCLNGHMRINYVCTIHTNTYIHMYIYIVNCMHRYMHMYDNYEGINLNSYRPFPPFTTPIYTYNNTYIFFRRILTFDNVFMIVIPYGVNYYSTI